MYVHVDENTTQLNDTLSPSLVTLALRLLSDRPSLDESCAYMVFESADSSVLRKASTAAHAAIGAGMSSLSLVGCGAGAGGRDLRYLSVTCSHPAGA